MHTIHFGNGYDVLIHNYWCMRVRLHITSLRRRRLWYIISNVWSFVDALGKFRRIIYILEMDDRRAKLCEIWDSGGSCGMYIGYSWPFIIQGYFGVIWCTCLKMVCNSKTASHRAKWSEIWESWVVVTCIWGSFNLLAFNLVYLSENGP